MTGERDGGGEKRRPYLPSGYYLDETTDSDAVILTREDGSEVAIFGVTGADPREIERAAWEDHRERSR